MQPLFVTSNENKAREAAEILGMDLERTSLDLREIQAIDIAAVAADKALAAREALGSPRRPIIVEDSGLIIEAWNDLPGPFTKWFLASVGNEGILRMLSGADRTAHAVCVVAISDGRGSVETFRGKVAGIVADEPRGESGFGFDPIFIPEGQELTYAEMGGGKHEDSHRTRAFRAARAWLEKVDQGWTLPGGSGGF